MRRTHVEPDVPFPDPPDRKEEDSIGDDLSKVETIIRGIGSDYFRQGEDGVFDCCVSIIDKIHDLEREIDKTFQEDRG